MPTRTQSELDSTLISSTRSHSLLSLIGLPRHRLRPPPHLPPSLHPSPSSLPTQQHRPSNSFTLPLPHSLRLSPPHASALEVAKSVVPASAPQRSWVRACSFATWNERAGPREWEWGCRGGGGEREGEEEEEAGTKGEGTSRVVCEVFGEVEFV